MKEAAITELEVWARRHLAAGESAEDMASVLTGALAGAIDQIKDAQQRAEMCDLANAKLESSKASKPPLYVVGDKIAACVETPNHKTR